MLLSHYDSIKCIHITFTVGIFREKGPQITWSRVNVVSYIIHNLIHFCLVVDVSHLYLWLVEVILAADHNTFKAKKEVTSIGWQGHIQSRDQKVVELRDRKSG